MGGVMLIPSMNDTGRQRPLSLIGLGLCLWWLLAAVPANGAVLSAADQARLAKGERHAKNGWIYLHLEGSPRDRGFQHGYLLAWEINGGLQACRAMWKHYTSREWAWAVDKTSRFLEPKVDPENLAEIDGLVEGMKAAGLEVSRPELIVYNAWFELSYWWEEEKKKTGEGSPQAPHESCSAFIATGGMTRDGGVVLGHNTMDSYAGALANVVVDLVPERGHRILMQCWPGWLHSGTDFFVTDAGLVGAETTIGGFAGYDEKGVPEFVRMRRATQDAASLDEWCAIMKKGNNGGYANAWLLGDVRSGEIARLELGLKFVREERKLDGYFTGSNIAEDLRILRLETSANDADIRTSSVARRVQWEKLMRQHAGKIDLALARQFEADHFDPYFEKVLPGGRSLCAHFDLDREFWGSWPGGPFNPAGTYDGKVVDSTLARQMSFSARWGAACGRPFDAGKFLAAHPQFAWMKDVLKSRPAQPWTVFRAGEKPPAKP
jgi:hypothetical protein